MRGLLRARARDQRGFTLIELMITIVMVGILMAIGLMLYANVEARARLTKARADVRTLAGAVAVYTAHAGMPPSGLPDLTDAVVAGGLSVGPFIDAIPPPPIGWIPYSYTPATGGGFSITTAGDSTTVRIP